MDNYMQSAQKQIGGSSDSAQLAQSYMWSKIAKNEYDDEYKDLYNNVVVLACLAQVAIDGCKKQFEINVSDEIARIRAMPCMKRSKDYPKFMKWTHNIAVTKNGKDRPLNDIKKDRKKVADRIDETIICPMNWLEDCLDKIQGLSKNVRIETAEFLIPRISAKPKATQMTKIRKIIERYELFLIGFMRNADDYDDSDYLLLKDKIDETTKEISEMSISVATMRRLIETSLNVEGRTHTDAIYKTATKHTRKMLNFLYKTNREKFLSCFRQYGFSSKQ